MFIGIALVILVPSALYLVLSTEWATDKLKDFAEEELTQLLGTNLKIGKINIQPFNIVSIKDITVEDDFGKTALEVGEIQTRFELRYFLTKGRLMFDYVELNGADITLYKQTPESPLNIANIIERLKSEDKDKKPTKFDLAIYTVRINDSRVKFDILDKPERKGRFDANHIEISNLDLYATAPKISNEETSGQIRRLSFTDKSGFRVNNIKTKAIYRPNGLEIENLEIDLPASHFDLGSYDIKYESPEDAINRIKEEGIELKIAEGSYFNTSDFGAFLPQLSPVKRRFNISSAISLSETQADIKSLKINEVTDGGFLFSLSGKINSPFNAKEISATDVKFDVKAYSHSIIDFIRKLDLKTPGNIVQSIDRASYIAIKGRGVGNAKEINSDFEIVTGLGKVNSKIEIERADSRNDFNAWGTFDVKDLNAGRLFNTNEIGAVSAQIEGSASVQAGKLYVCDFTTRNASVSFRNKEIIGNELSFELTETGFFEGHIDVKDGNASVLASVSGNTDKETPSMRGEISLENVNPYSYGILKKYQDYELDTDIDFDLTGVKGEWIDGFVKIDGFKFRSHDPTQKQLDFKHLTISADNTIRPNIISVESDFINGSLEGNISLLNLLSQTKDIVAEVVPVLTKKKPAEEKQTNARQNEFRFNFELSNTENIVEFFNLPVAVIYPISIDGQVKSKEKELVVGVDAPYLMKGDMIIEQTSVQAVFNGETPEGRIYLTTQFPTKKGVMSVVGGVDAKNDTISTEIEWNIERDKPLFGTFKFDTMLSRDVDNGELCAKVDFVPSELHFGNDIWKFAPSSISYKPKYLAVNDFGLATETQSIKINGICEASDPDSQISINLDNVVLNTIFETLDINKALIGGIATGTMFAGGIFSEQPFITCDDLHVDDIGYNHCVLGDGDIKARWDNDRKSVYLDAVVHQEDGRKSYIRGDIFPMSESLDISFDADKVKVGFMKPFMDAFAEDITGYASGHARIFGTFKYIDMEGDVYAEDLGLKVGFTNTWYYATDSIHITPGLIDVDSVTVWDKEGHTALLNGVVKHNFFKDPVFDFKVTNAHNFLSYDVTPNLSPDWYGTIYGNGSAFITGSPGVVNIDVNMSTAEGSTFTFVLSDMEEAEQYNFITFRDKNRNVVTDSIIQTEILPPEVIAYRDKLRQQALAQNPPSAYNMNIQIDITPAAKIIIVMDPVGGDEIKSWGKGNMRMTYTSIGNDLRMYGTYAIDRGSYNFTLQDIIVKDFTIKEGSSITFTGDPYNASLDIVASYAVNANLSDLDESFLNDPELNRTNVPVHALLLVRGDMRQPDIDFDLEFPTLTSDVYRKVRSIISTDEMMNRQMIYLLALNRFYTPEYMSATKGNELFSVASSTISSRLSSMLGKLSENWNITPNLRSDKGDFSDVQFDVALSSNLLNNRLRMNGNFGYRDKSLNTTQFIGDFDLEYLINRSGTWRLKAYNRFNDQTYFLRTAKTTQGIGIMFQRDFDDMFGFLRPKKKKEEKAKEETK